MNKTKINELVECISKCDADNYIEAITNLGLTVKDFEGDIHFSEKKYTRTCIAEDENFELILLGWSKGQKTPIHNHDGHEGFVYALKGKIKEVRYHLNSNNELEKESEGILNENQVAYAKKDINGFHTIENISNDNALTLHLYKKPIKKCLILEKDELVTKEMAYDFIA